MFKKSIPGLVCCRGGSIVLSFRGLGAMSGGSSRDKYRISSDIPTGLSKGVHIFDVQ